MNQEMVWARHILVATEEEAKTVLAELQSGGDFAALAAKYSTDTSNKDTGGDLGWFYKGQMVAPFEEAAYSLSIGEISEPVKSDFGYHIIQALGHEIRQLTESQFDNLKTIAYSKFIEDAKADVTIKRYDIWAKVVPSTPTVPTQYRIAQ
jgi:parvulin-like peptidyl-prolyl isomerase